MSKLHVKTGDTVILLTGDKKDRIENGKPYTIAYAKTFNEAKALKERFENSGALVDVGLKRAFKEQKIEKNGTPLYDALCEGFQTYAKKQKELRKNLAFCVIGWPLLAIGICLLVFANFWVSSISGHKVSRLPLIQKKTPSRQHKTINLEE